MQLEKAKKVVESLVEVCDSMERLFYLASSSGMISNKMECIQSSYKVIYSTTCMYNLVPKNSPLISSLNSLFQRFTPSVESVNSTFSSMFNIIQQFRVLLKAWQDELEQPPE